jgi:hypothetical protein
MRAHQEHHGSGGRKEELRFLSISYSIDEPMMCLYVGEDIFTKNSGDGADGQGTDVVTHTQPRTLT